MESNPQHIILCATADPNYDQRMLRISGSLAKHYPKVTLLGRQTPRSVQLVERSFVQERIHCIFGSGALMYAEFNTRLFIKLLFSRFDIVCAADLDTLPACWLAAKLKGKAVIYDAHEYFTEVPELAERPAVKRFWRWIGQTFVPRTQARYTVGAALAKALEQEYRVPFGLVRNMPLAQQLKPTRPLPEAKILLYQGALNTGRGLAEMIEAMQHLEGFELWIAGEGDLSASLRAQCEKLSLEHRVKFLGYQLPEHLRQITPQAWLGINVLENNSLNYYYSLANKFFDYVQAGVPSLNMRFPEYEALNQEKAVGILLDELNPEALVKCIQTLAEQPETYAQLQANCSLAAQDWTWQKEEQTLLKIWNNIT